MIEVGVKHEGLPLGDVAAVAPSARTDRQTALTVSDLSVTFGGVRALDDVAFHVDPNEVIAVVGPNGAGKTTLLNAICGLVPIRKSCRLIMDGESLVGKRVAARAAAGLGRSYQHPPLLEHASVLDNLRCGGHLIAGYGIGEQFVKPFGVRRKEENLTVRCDEVLEFIGLSHLRNVGVRELPYGVRKLVDIGRALVSSPKLLMLDEPSSGLDSREQSIVVGIVRGLKNLGSMAVLLVEHHMDVVRSTSDRVIGMQAGAVLTVGTPSEVLDSPGFQEAVIGGSQLPNSERGEKAR